MNFAIVSLFSVRDFVGISLKVVGLLALRALILTLISFSLRTLNENLLPIF